MSLRIEHADPQGAEALALLREAAVEGYGPIAPFGEYANDPTSRCFGKRLA